MGLLDGFMSLGRNLNKSKGEFQDETREGVVSEVTSEISLEKSDGELAKLCKSWKARWESSEVRKELERKQKENEKYWLGDHYTTAQKQTGKREPVDNLIFESLETFLPVATRKNPEPVIGTDKTPEAEMVGKKLEDRLINLADTLRLKLKIKKSTRHWSLYYVGVIKLGWSMQENEIAIQAVRPQQLILDPDAITDECEYDGEYLGHYKTETATNLMNRFPDKAEEIKKKVEDKTGTKLRYVEWWTPDSLFWELEGEILGKAKNPNWNYEQETTAEKVDEFGNVSMVPQTIPGVNHFSNPKIPFAFLSVFNLGKSPVDDTNLIEQSLPTQDVINKRVKQIDRNADQMNAGAVVSGDAFTMEQAKQVADALRKGLTVWVPRGNVDNVYKRDTGSPMPSFVYESLVDSRNELRNIFGTTGLSSSGIKGEDTVRGKILIRGTDTDRATLVVDHLEQFADYIFNWMVQLMYVHYDTPHMISNSQGPDTITSQELFPFKFTVSVKDGSMIPEDRLTKRNEAVDLWNAQALDPITLFERLDDPNPVESAKRLFLWQNNPIALFPDLQAQLAPSPTTPAQPGDPAQEKGQQVAPDNLLNQVPIQ